MRLSKKVKKLFCSTLTLLLLLQPISVLAETSVSDNEVLNAEAAPSNEDIIFSKNVVGTSGTAKLIVSKDKELYVTGTAEFAQPADLFKEVPEEYRSQITKVDASEASIVLNGNPVSTAEWFKGYTSVESVDISGICNQETHSIMYAKDMFDGCTSLEYIDMSGLYFGDLYSVYHGKESQTSNGGSYTTADTKLKIGNTTLTNADMQYQYAETQYDNAIYHFDAEGTANYNDGRTPVYYRAETVFPVDIPLKTLVAPAGTISLSGILNQGKLLKNNETGEFVLNNTVFKPSNSDYIIPLFKTTLEQGKRYSTVGTNRSINFVGTSNQYKEEHPKLWYLTENDWFYLNTRDWSNEKPTRSAYGSSITFDKFYLTPTHSASSSYFPAMSGDKYYTGSRWGKYYLADAKAISDDIVSYLKGEKTVSLYAQFKQNGSEIPIVSEESNIPKLKLGDGVYDTSATQESQPTYIIYSVDTVEVNVVDESKPKQLRVKGIDFDWSNSTIPYRMGGGYNNTSRIEYIEVTDEWGNIGYATFDYRKDDEPSELAKQAMAELKKINGKEVDSKVVIKLPIGVKVRKGFSEITTVVEEDVTFDDGSYTIIFQDDPTRYQEIYQFTVKVKQTPTGGDDNPTGGDVNPIGGDDNPTGGDVNPSGGDDTPTGGDVNPTGGDTPTSSTPETKDLDNDPNTVTTQNGNTVTVTTTPTAKEEKVEVEYEVKGDTASVKNVDTVSKTVKIQSEITTSSGKKVKVTEIAGEAFKDNSVTEKVVIPSTVKTINTAAFKNCSKLKTVSLSKSVTSISDEAFYGCKKLTSIVIPKGTKKIGKNAFYGCTSLKKVTIKSTSLKKVGAKAFKKCNKKLVIKVPGKKLNAYKKLLKNKIDKKATIKK